MHSFLLLLLVLALHSVAVTIRGPEAIFACNTFGFSFEDGTTPYTFHPMLGAGPEGETLGAVEQGYFSTNDSVYWLYINNAPGSVMEFYVTDATQAMSDTLWYVVQDRGSCRTSTVTASIISAVQGNATTPFTPPTTTGMGGAVSNTATASLAVDVPTFITMRPSGQSESPSPISPSTSTIMAVVGTVAGVLLLAIGFCIWRWCRARKARTVHRIRRTQPRDLMMNADKNDSGLLLTAPSPSYGPVPSTPTSGGRIMPTAPPVLHLLPSTKEMRMRGAVNRDQDLEDGLSVSDVSGPVSTARSTSIWPESNAFSVHQPSQAHSRSRPTVPNSQQSLQAIIGRELENILQNPQTLTSSPTTSLTDALSPFSSLNDLRDSETSGDHHPPPNSVSERPNLALTIPGTPPLKRDARSILPSATTPISRRDMEVLADLVAQRLIRDRGTDAPTLDPNPEMPPPSYS